MKKITLLNYISQEKYEILQGINGILQKNGFEIRIVGGFVRDIILGFTCKKLDIDLSTNANPKQLQQIFKNTDFVVKDIGGQIFGTSIIIDKKTKISFELTSCRKDIQTFGRRANVEFTDSFELDSQRRDFTVNAIYVDMNGEIYDFHNGINDLKSKKLRFIGDAKARIQEDYLRILRYFRFASILGNFDPKTMEICKNLSESLKQISMQRVVSEIKKIIEKNSINSLYYMEKYNIFTAISLGVNFALLEKIAKMPKKTLESTELDEMATTLIAFLLDKQNSNILQFCFTKQEMSLFKNGLENNTNLNLAKLFAKNQDIAKCMQKVIFHSDNPSTDLETLEKFAKFEKPKIDISGLKGAEISKKIAMDLEEFYSHCF